MFLDKGPTRLVKAAQFGVLIQLVATGLSLWAERSGFDGLLGVTSGVELVLFLAGALALLVGFGKGISRSREELVGVGALFFLSEAGVPPRDRRLIYASVVGQVVIGIVGASLAPLTAVAFTTLAPAFGFGVMALYGGNHATFQPKQSATSIDS